MKSGPKPVHACYTCPLNMGRYCWQYAAPRQQWRGQKCPGFNNQALLLQYQAWREAPHVKTRRQLRQEAFRTSRTALFLHRRKMKARQHL